MTWDTLEDLLRDAHAASGASEPSTPIYRKTENARERCRVGLSSLPVEHRIVFLVVDGETPADQLTRNHPAIPGFAAILLELERGGFIERV